jgi:hypothetical protein
MLKQRGYLILTVTVPRELKKEIKFLTCLRLDGRNRLTQSMNVEDNAKQNPNARLHSPYWETNSRSADHEIMLLLWKLVFQYCFHKNPLRPVSWAEWIQFRSTYFIPIGLILILCFHLRQGLPIVRFLSYSDADIICISYPSRRCYMCLPLHVP